MNVTVDHQHPDAAAVACQGDLDYGSAEEFLHAVEAITASAITVDFAEVDFVDSTGIRALCRAVEDARERGSELVVVNIGENIYEILTLVGCIDTFGEETFAKRSQ